MCTWGSSRHKLYGQYFRRSSYGYWWRWRQSRRHSHFWRGSSCIGTWHKQGLLRWLIQPWQSTCFGFSPALSGLPKLRYDFGWSWTSHVPRLRRTPIWVERVEGLQLYPQSSTMTTTPTRLRLWALVAPFSCDSQSLVVDDVQDFGKSIHFVSLNYWLSKEDQNSSWYTPMHFVTKEYIKTLVSQTEHTKPKG